jgi:hypothetical protein
MIQQKMTADDVHALADWMTFVARLLYDLRQSAAAQIPC